MKVSDVSGKLQVFGRDKVFELQAWVMQIADSVSRVSNEASQNRHLQGL